MQLLVQCVVIMWSHNAIGHTCMTIMDRAKFYGRMIVQSTINKHDEASIYGCVMVQTFIEA